VLMAQFLLTGLNNSKKNKKSLTFFLTTADKHVIL